MSPKIGCACDTCEIASLKAELEQERKRGDDHLGAYHKEHALLEAAQKWGNGLMTLILEERADSALAFKEMALTTAAMERIADQRDGARAAIQGLIGHALVDYRGGYAAIEVETEYWHACRRILEDK